jgi:hypothetical protein
VPSLVPVNRPRLGEGGGARLVFRPIGNRNVVRGAGGQSDACREPANPRTREPANPRTREPANPRTREPANPRTGRARAPGQGKEGQGPRRACGPSRSTSVLDRTRSPRWRPTQRSSRRRGVASGWRDATTEPASRQRAEPGVRR